ncbi:MAG TPA: hypothetical protein PLJ76_00635 [Treponemataceae bacterium]|nr:hypothetical protein [Treponemataceae bacterium]
MILARGFAFESDIKSVIDLLEGYNQSHDKSHLVKGESLDIVRYTPGME